jgi:C-terminal processing protease CtpA/Prc
MLIIFFYSSIKGCVRTYYVYYKFSSRIHPYNAIFHELKTQQTYFPENFCEEARLFYLCKVWGFVKYHNENSTLFPLMDSLLIASIPQVIQAAGKLEFANVLKKLITPAMLFKSTGTNPYPNLEDYLLMNNQWMNDTVCLFPGLKADLDTIWTRHTGINNFASNKSMAGNIRLKNEPVYPEFPNETIRLLGLFRYWNVINYFYVYKNYMDESWDKILYEFISDFKQADTNEKYHQAIYRLTNQLRDAHASYPPTIDGVVFGPYRPNFRMAFIDSTFIISKIRMPEYGKENFEIGDMVLKVDNQDIHALSDSLGQYVCGGNYWSNQSFLCNAILSRKDSTTLFTLVRGNDTLLVKSKNYPVYPMFQAERKKEKKNEKKPLYQWINDSIAYFDLQSATPDNFAKNYKSVRSASTIILDLRCYPHSHLILNLTDAFVPPNSFFAYVTYPDVRFPGLVRYIKSSSNNIGHKDYFKGKVIVLVNEWTQSYSEYTTMALQANPKTITVGNFSSGSDGNITTFEFPGGINTIYSGIGIYYPDFTPTQRIGVRVDYIVEPTVASIKQGIDSAYERAVEIAKQ